MDKRYKIILSIFILCLVMTVGIGVSFAYYTAVIENGEESRSIVSKSANLEITYTDGSKQIIGANVYPDWSETKTFTVKNTGDTDSAYAIKLTNIVNKFTVPGSISFSWTAKGGPADLDEYILPTVGTSETIRDITFIGVGETHEYTITTYYNNVNYDQSEDKGKSFSFTIEIESVKSWTPKGWNTAADGTLLAGIKANYPKATNPLTDARSSESLDVIEEAELSAAPDDYGTSYYFRGAVENNYVTFANMCWRIVRILGNGAIKLTLFNYNSTDCTEYADDNAFIHTNDKLLKTVFTNVSDYGSPAGIGLMYGDVNGKNYAATHANTNKSSVLIQLETWYKSKLNSYGTKLADVIWCNDKSTTGETYEYTFSEKDNLIEDYFPGDGYGISFYDENTGNKNNMFSPGLRTYGNISYIEGGNYTRMSYGSGSTFVCPMANNGTKLSKFTVSDTANGNGSLTYKIGLLTIDEVIMAGLAGPAVMLNKNYNNDNSLSYLVENTSASSYWTLSPNKVDPVLLDYKVFIASNQGTDDSYIFSSNAIRPAIALNADITINGGDGSIVDPFVIS